MINVLKDATKYPENEAQALASFEKGCPHAVSVLPWLWLQIQLQSSDDSKIPGLFTKRFKSCCRNSL